VLIATLSRKLRIDDTKVYVIWRALYFVAGGAMALIRPAMSMHSASLPC
jgi:hypothetical protein